MPPQKLKDKKDVVSFIAHHQELMNILRMVHDLDLPDCWICAGFLRARIWDYQSGLSQPTPVHDVDVVYFDAKRIDYDFEQEVQIELKNRECSYNWEVKNEARMHLHNPDTVPYCSSTDAIAKFPETVTSIGARLDSANQVEVAAPHGVSDLLTMVVRPTPYALIASKRLMLYKKRIAQKNWQTIWPLLTIDYR